MANGPRSAVVSMRLPPDVKARFAALAARHHLTESGLLSKLIDKCCARMHRAQLLQGWWQMRVTPRRTLHPGTASRCAFAMAIACVPQSAPARGA
ncbi:hypothetical protein [Xenophilus azovorans]|uniref:hypothetical protein n=1 Tax=Xenophilus azovorans TaxID=151755 RepID=UPI001470260E|nr:hypothetical protein [Xenophilus azovorans]